MEEINLETTKAYHITVKGRVKEITPAHGREFQLEEAQDYVKGDIETVYLTDNRIMIVNENGKNEGQERNNLATILAKLSHAIWFNDEIVGDVVICPSGMLS